MYMDNNRRQKENCVAVYKQAWLRKKYCHHSPSLEESVLQSAIVQAVQNNIGKCSEVLEKLKQHIRIELSGEQTEDKTIDIQIEIARLDKEYDDLLNRITSDMENAESLESQLEKIVLKNTVCKKNCKYMKTQAADRQIQKQDLMKSSKLSKVLKTTLWNLTM